MKEASWRFIHYAGNVGFREFFFFSNSDYISCFGEATAVSDNVQQTSSVHRCDNANLLYTIV